MSPAILILVGAVVVVFALKKAGQVSTNQVGDLLKQNPVIVDVRSEGEYARAHIDRVVHLPLDRFKQDLSTIAPDKDVPLLLHCASGGRSAYARRVAVGMGYTNAHNLGSYARAEKLLKGRP